MHAKDNPEPSSGYGGQAVIEGVMMRSPRYFAVACRREDTKEIVVQQDCVQSVLRRFQWLDKPFLRGTLALIDALVLGMKALMFSANVAMESVQQQAVRDGEAKVPSPKEAKRAQSVNDVAIGATMFLGLALGIGIFMIGPKYLSDILGRWIHTPLWLNLAEGIIRIVLFVGYVYAISLMKDIQRVFQYHGAEHKVINTFEEGLDLTPENFSEHTTVHPRCGTSFILVVLVLSIVVYSFIPRSHEGGLMAHLVPVFWRLALLPVIAGFAYEVIKFAGKHRDSGIVSALLSPGLLLQRLTTRAPEDAQVEVALRALEAVMAMEKDAVECPES